jgi:RNA polymerase sigma-70 factor (ECF subfamily)
VTQEEEMQMVRDILAGSEVAFTRLYDHFQARVRASVFRIVHPDDVDDIVQMTFLKVHQKLHTFAGDARLSTWLHRVAVNTALHNLRVAKAHGGGKTVSIDETREDDGGSFAPVLELSYEDNTAASNSDRFLLYKAMATLATKDRAILADTLQGYTNKEIMSRRGSDSMSGTKSDIYRARVRLKAAVLRLMEPGAVVKELRGGLPI